MIYFLKLLAFFFPKVCTICAEEGSSICKQCLVKAGNNLQEQTFENVKAFSCFEYNEVSSKIIKDFKYFGKTENAKIISEIIWQKFKTEILETDYIIPVGTNFIKQVIRRYNCPNLIANQLSKKIKAKNLFLFFKKKNFTSQVGLKRQERMKNLEGAFVVKKQYDFTGKKILLVDDVITTGATILTCIKEVKRFNPAKITVVSFARRDL